MTITPEVSFDIICSCGCSIEGDVIDRRGSIEIKLEECPDCKKSREQDIEAMDKEIEALNEEIEKMQDTIDALQISLTYARIQSVIPIF
jgi:hypothetical protein